MTAMSVALRWVARLDGTTALILGNHPLDRLPRRSQNPYSYRLYSMPMSNIVKLIVGFLARVKPALPIVAIVFAVLLPYVGFAQLMLFPAAIHIIIQAIHLLIGICAIGIAEALVAKSKRQPRA